MQLARGHRYPIWSVKAVLLISIPVLAIITVLVFVLSDRSVIVESQISMLVISLTLFGLGVSNVVLYVRAVPSMTKGETIASIGVVRR